MTFRTVCAWCGAFISEKECSATQNSLALSKDGIVTSHGLCPACRKKIETTYGLNPGGKKNG